MCRTGRTGWQTITATCFSRKSSITFGSSSCSSYSTASALSALVMTHDSLSVSAWSMQGRIHSVTAVCPTQIATWEMFSKNEARSSQSRSFSDEMMCGSSSSPDKSHGRCRCQTDEDSGHSWKLESTTCF